MEPTTLAEALLADRSRLGHTQQKVADILGVGQQSYSKWEAGINEPRARWGLELIKFFGSESATAKVINKPIPERGGISNIFAKNLRFLMVSNGIKNVNELSRRTRIAQPTLFRWLGAEAREPRHSNLLPIAEYFGVGVNELLTHDLSTGEPLRINEAIARAHVPVIEWSDTLRHTELIQEKNIETWPSISLRLNTQAFATKVKGNAMAPLIPEGAMVIVQINHQATHNDYVLVAGAVPFIRRLSYEPDGQYLMPAGYGFRAVKMDATHRIIGVVREVQQITLL